MFCHYKTHTRFQRLSTIKKNVKYFINDDRKKRGLKKKRKRKKETRREGEKLVKSREGEGREEGRYFIFVGRDI